MHYIVAAIVAALVGAIAYFVGTLFDPTLDNRYAKLGGLAVFILVFLAYIGIL